MNLNDYKKLFTYGWLAKNEDGFWSWFSKKPELLYDDDDMLYYWYGDDRIELNWIDGTEDIWCVDSLIELVMEK